jgi:TPR repeat protein
MAPRKANVRPAAAGGGSLLWGRLNTFNSQSEIRAMDDRFNLADDAYERGEHDGAFSKFLELAEDGDVDAMARVACMYSDGEGTAWSLDKSLEWDLRAASLGGTTSMFNLGITYRNSGNAREARRWFEKLHMSGDGDASLELAKMYMVSDLEGQRIKTYLLAAVQSSHVCEASREEAQELLNSLGYGVQADAQDARQAGV